MKISIYLTISLMIVSLILGVVFGYFISPEYQQTMYKKEAMDLGEADRFIDLRYIDAMAAHHRGAMLLAGQVKDRSNRKEINELAGEILKNEPKLIDELYQWKRDWYKDFRSVKDPKVANLGDPDEKMELRFLNALIAHHEEGIKMTKEVKTKSSRAEILNNADAVENFLSNSLTALRNWRRDWYNVN